jgi:hypothetical protein
MYKENISSIKMSGLAHLPATIPNYILGTAANPRQPIPPTAATLMSSLLGAAREVAVAVAGELRRAWPGGWSWAARRRILEPRWDPPPQPQSELGGAAAPYVLEGSSSRGQLPELF